MLGLAAATDPAWAGRVLEEPGALLVDHAHCEKKAAGTALNLIFRYPQHGFLHAPLSRLAREELSHFEQVLHLLESRGLRFEAQRPSAYAARLRRSIRTHEPARLLDTLLCCALIEARSCERFRLLSEATADPELHSFYVGLLACEARHHGVYVELGCVLVPEGEGRARLAELASEEARVLASVPPLPRMHA